MADSDDGVANMLTDEERAAGWRLLFDGASTEHWRGYRSDSFPDGWVIDGDALHRAAPAGDIVTIEQFEDIDLRLEWKVDEGAGNSASSSACRRTTSASGRPARRCRC